MSRIRSEIVNIAQLVVQLPMDDPTLGQAVLNTYLRQWAALPRNAGRLFVAFEPGTPQPRVQWVRKQVIDSGLCEQRRCAEVGWEVRRPVVN